MLKAFKYRIYPNQAAKKAIDQTLWTCRSLYNAALNERIDEYKFNGKTLNYYDQANSLKFLKENNRYFKMVHSQVLQDVLKRLEKAYQAFFRRVKTGETAGFPRFQGKERYNSFTYPQGGYSFVGNRLELSKIGNVKVKLSRPVEGKVKTCTVIRKNDKYYVCFSCEVETTKELHSTGKSVGIDMGLAKFYTDSNGKTKECPKTYRKSEKRLKQLQRQVSKKKKGSKRRKKAVKQLAKQHEHVANQRKDIAFKASKELLDNYDTIVHEDLKIKNMVKNHKLAKSILDAAWGMFFNILESKAKQAPCKRVIAVDPKYTSQTCSNCGHVSAENRKTQADFKCQSCGFELNADWNAAINILEKAVA